MINVKIASKSLDDRPYTNFQLFQHKKGLADRGFLGKKKIVYLVSYGTQ